MLERLYVKGAVVTSFFTSLIVFSLTDADQVYIHTYTYILLTDHNSD